MWLRLEGFDVGVIASIEETEASALGHPPDLVIADYHLRGRQTGPNVIHALRQTRADLPFILVSGDTPGSIDLTSLSDVALMMKPMDAEEMLAEIRRSIKRA